MSRAPMWSSGYEVHPTDPNREIFRKTIVPVSGVVYRRKKNGKGYHAIDYVLSKDKKRKVEEYIIPADKLEAHVRWFQEGRLIIGQESLVVHIRPKGSRRKDGTWEPYDSRPSYAYDELPMDGDVYLMSLLQCGEFARARAHYKQYRHAKTTERQQQFVDAYVVVKDSVDKKLAEAELQNLFGL